ncbi:MAG: Holliday junction resolvase RuvX [Bacteroidetes bacterium]|nr:Holliday junction resolvase RuvX [Bacteroidota bacterium]
MRNRSRVLSIDYGTKRVGLAISDELRMLARPFTTLSQSPALLNDILSLVEKEAVGFVLLGLPRSLMGGDSEMTTEVRTFGERLFERLDAVGVGHAFHDERLTSIMAANNLRSSGLSKSKRQEKHRHDEEAARIILQEYLDSQG